MSLSHLRSRIVGSGLLPIIAILTLVFVGFVPLVGRLTTHLISPGTGLHDDTTVHLWQYWWFHHFLTEGGSLFNNRMLFYPETIDMASLWEGHLDLLISAPLLDWLGVIGASNVVAAVLLGSAGLGTYFLALAVTGGRLASTVAAMLFMLSPPLLREVLEGRAEVISVGFVALFLLFLGRWYASGNWRNLLPATLAFALAILGYLALAPMTVFLLPLLGLGYLISGRRAAAPWASPRVWLRRSAGLFGLLLLLGLPALLFMSSHLGHDWSFGIDYGEGGLSVTPTYQRWHAFNEESSLSPAQLLSPFPLGNPPGTGLALFLAACTSLLFRGRRGTAVALLPFWLGALVFHLFALGPELFSLGDDAYVASPYSYIPWVFPFFLRFCWSYRFLFLADLCLAVLAARGLHMLWAGAQERKRRLWLCWGGAALILLLGVGQVMHLFPLPVQPMPRVPDVYGKLAADRPTAIIEATSMAPESSLPFLYSPVLAQLHHGAPFCCLRLPKAMTPVGVRKIQARNQLFYSLTNLSAELPPEDADPLSLARLGFSHVVLHGRPASPTPAHDMPPRPKADGLPYEVMAPMLGRILGPPVYRHFFNNGGVIEVYRIPGSRD